MEVNKKIKSFVYLDEYKMYSISSQLFEGLTEYILANDKESLSENNTQKGKIGSGQVMGDILLKEKMSTEKRYLHDYAFNVFEGELEKLGKVSNSFAEMKTKPFIKIKGKAIFNDYSILLEMVKNFNNIGEALGYMSNTDFYKEMHNMKKTASNFKDRNTNVKAKQLVKTLNSKYIDALIEQGLMMESDFLERMETLLEYGYNQLFEVNLFDSENNIVFSSTLNRKYLREEENILIARFSRKTEMEFTIFGILTQSG
ncbi:MAG TPA: hypothetical protein DIT04_13835, partial [Dysgonomonas sp.]|nr:hypothetical protein [Dysgonomonas sp.]